MLVNDNNILHSAQLHFPFFTVGADSPGSLRVCRLFAIVLAEEDCLHWQQMQFLYAARDIFSQFFTGGDVLEIGSFDVNGSVRMLFAADRYVGVDLMPGPGVDWVGSGHEYRSSTCFDTVVSCECLEHNPHYAATFENMMALAKPGGLVVFTCASKGRPEHGTSRTTPRESPGTQMAGWDYYCNLGAADFPAEQLDRRFAHWFIHDNRTDFDLYFMGVTKGGEVDYAEAFRCVRERTPQIEALSRRVAATEKLAARGDSDAAAEQLGQLAPEPENPAFYKRMALLLRRWDYLEKALEAVQHELMLAPSLGDAHSRAGMLLARLGRKDEAEEAGRKAVALQPDVARHHLRLGMFLMAQQNLGEAESEARKAVSLDPDFAVGHRQLSRILAKAGKAGGAG